MWQHVTEAVTNYMILHQSGALHVNTFGIQQYTTGWLVDWLEKR